MIIFDATVEPDSDPQITILEMVSFAVRNGCKVRATIDGVEIVAGGVNSDYLDLWQRWQAVKAGRIAPDPAPAPEGGEEA